MMRFPHFRTGLAVLALSAVFALPAQALPLSASNSNAAIVDGTFSTRNVTFSSAGIITGMTVTLDFMKCNEDISSPPPASCAVDGDFVFPEEIVFKLTSPNGTQVSLIEADTYDLNFDNGEFRITVTFDDSASASIADPAFPGSGSFKGVQQLALFNGQNTVGINPWTLYIEDTGLGDPLILHSFTLNAEVRDQSTGQVPVPGTLALLGLGLAGLGALKRRR